MLTSSGNKINFDTLAKTYDSWYKTEKGSYLDKLEKKAVLKLAQPKAGEKALDVGCGTGNYTYLLANSGLNVTGIDSSEEMIRNAVKKMRGNCKVKFILDKAELLSFGNDEFDLVLAIAALEFIRDPISAIDEMFRVLKTNGRLVLGFFNKYSLWSLLRRIRGIFSDSIYNQAQFYSLNEMKHWLGRYGEVEILAVPLLPQRFQFGSIIWSNPLWKKLCGFLVMKAENQLGIIEP